MKRFLCVCLFLAPLSSSAQDKVWFSSSVEVGYGKMYLAEKITFENGAYTKNSVNLGLKFKIVEHVDYKVFYLLENFKENKWLADHFLGFSIGFKFQ